MKREKNGIKLNNLIIVKCKEKRRSKGVSHISLFVSHKTVTRKK